MQKIIEISKQDNMDGTVDYQVDFSDEFDNEVEEETWIYEMQKNLIDAVVDTVGRKERGLMPFHENIEFFDLKIMQKDYKKAVKETTSILSRDGLNELLEGFDEKQMAEYKKINKTFLKEVGDLSSQYIRRIEAIAGK